MSQVAQLRLNGANGQSSMDDGVDDVYGFMRAYARGRRACVCVCAFGLKLLLLLLLTGIAINGALDFEKPHSIALCPVLSRRVAARCAVCFRRCEDDNLLLHTDILNF